MLLNGSPSAGKSSLAKAVQRVAPTPVFHRSLDHFLAGYSTPWREQDRRLFGRVMTGYVHSLAALVRAGCDVVAEAVLIPEWRGLYSEALSGVPVLLVGVRCDLAVAQARESVRTDREHVELDVPYFETVHDLVYDAEVDTSTNPSPDELAATLVELYQRPPQPRAFSLLRGVG